MLFRRNPENGAAAGALKEQVPVVLHERHAGVDHLERGVAAGGTLGRGHCSIPPGGVSTAAGESAATADTDAVRERIERILAQLPVGTSADLRIDLERILDAEAQMPEAWRLSRIAQLVGFHVAPKAEEPWRERVHAIARGEKHA